MYINVPKITMMQRAKINNRRITITCANYQLLFYVAKAYAFLPELATINFFQ